VRLERLDKRGEQRLEELRHRLAAAHGGREVPTVLVAASIDALDAAGGALALRDEALGVMRVAASLGLETTTVDAWRTFPLIAPVPIADADRSGEPVFLPTTDDAERRYPGMNFRSSRFRAWLAVPLRGGYTRGALGLAFTQERRFDRRERALIAAIAGECSLALARVGSSFPTS